MAQPIRQKHVIELPRYERVPVEPPATGFRSVKVGMDRVELIVEIDLHSILFAMGDRAFRSKTGKCRDGPVLVTHIRSKKK